mmetsp:Transcript_36740/g.93927  ORF Transcript_36740/g.93927 Transcript_36740/m.93927 type:complete len:221 (-) Transcript_36740:112-774(-)
MMPSRAMAFEHSSTVRNSTNANFFSALMYTLMTQSPWPVVPPTAASAWLMNIAMLCSVAVGGRPPTYTRRACRVACWVGGPATGGAPGSPGRPGMGGMPGRPGSPTGAGAASTPSGILSKPVFRRRSLRGGVRERERDLWRRERSRSRLRGRSRSRSRRSPLSLLRSPSRAPSSGRAASLCSERSRLRSRLRPSGAASSYSTIVLPRQSRGARPAAEATA